MRLNGLDTLVDDRRWQGRGVSKNPSDIFAQHADKGRLDAGRQKNQNDKRCKSLRWLSDNENEVGEVKKCRKERQKTENKTDQGNQLERLGRLAAHAIHGKTDQRHQTELAAAPFAFGAIIWDAGLFIAELCNCSPDVGRVISDFSEVFDNNSVDQSKVAGIDWQLDGAETCQASIEELSRRFQNEIFRAASADSIDDLVALFPGGQKLAKKLRRILQIGIDLNGRGAIGVQVVCQDRSLKAKISGEAKHANSIVAARFVGQPLKRGVGARIVGKEELEIVAWVGAGHSAQPLQ